eukprot:364540-Chlamydomonas_euryale.AAC.2
MPVSPIAPLPPSLHPVLHELLMDSHMINEAHEERRAPKAQQSQRPRSELQSGGQPDTKPPPPPHTHTHRDITHTITHTHRDISLENSRKHFAREAQAAGQVAICDAGDVVEDGDCGWQARAAGAAGCVESVPMNLARPSKAVWSSGRCGACLPEGLYRGLVCG